MKIFVSALLLLSFLSACEQMGMSSSMEDGMASDTMAMEGDMAMDGGMDSMSGG